MHELEKALFERALELGVRTIAHASVDIQGMYGPVQRYDVVARRGAAQRQDLQRRWSESLT